MFECKHQHILLPITWHCTSLLAHLLSDGSARRTLPKDTKCDAPGRWNRIWHRERSGCVETDRPDIGWKPEDCLSYVLTVLPHCFIRQERSRYRNGVNTMRRVGSYCVLRPFPPPTNNCTNVIIIWECFCLCLSRDDKIRERLTCIADTVSRISSWWQRGSTVWDTNMDSKAPPAAGVTLLRYIAVGNIVWGRGDRGTADALSTGIS
jgi:hypothetical protein